MGERVISLKLSNLHILETISEAISIITSRQRLKQFLTIPLYTNAVYLMVNAVFVSLFSFLFWVIVARFYTEADIGYSAAIISATTLMAALSLIGLNTSLIRFLPQSKKPQELINTCLTIGGLLSLVIAGIFLTGVDFWSPALSFIKENVVFVATFIILTLILTLLAPISSTFITRRKAGFVVLQCLIHSLIRLPLPLLFVLFLHSLGIVASWCIALGISLLVSLFIFMPKVQSDYKPIPTLKLSLLRGTWQYSGGNYLTQLFISIPFLILPIMVVNLLGAEQNAYFYIAWVIATMLPAIPYSISMSLFAEGSNFEDKLRENVIKSLKLTFMLLIPAVILTILVGKWLLLAFGQSYSANALYLLWILAISSLPMAINYIYTSILQVTHKIKELMIIWGFVAIAMLVVSYLLMPAMGIIGIGYAWLGVHCVVAIYVFAFARRQSVMVIVND